MKRFCFWLALLFFYDRLLGAALDANYRYVRWGECGGKLQYYADNQSKFPLVVLGASRSLNGIDPACLSQSAYNLSHSAMDLSFNACAVSLLGRQGKLPKVIVLDVAPEYFFRPAESMRGYQRLYYYYGSDPLVTRYVQEGSRTAPLEFLFSTRRYNGIVTANLYAAVKTKKGERAVTGYEPLAPGPKDLERLKASVQSGQDTEKLDPAVELRLIDFLDQCRLYGVRPVLVSTPTFATVWGNIGKYRVATARIRAIADHAKCPYLDYFSSAQPDLQSKDLWHDRLHLNSHGAEIFSKKLRTGLADFQLLL